MQLYKYPSIGQFRNVISEVKYLYKDKQLPTIEFIGTVKLHGTNASVVIKSDGTQYCQSRSNIITPDNDNYGFARWHQTRIDFFNDIYEQVTDYADCNGNDIVVYGEWAGKGIQKGVGISQVDKHFYVFAIAIANQDGSLRWIDFAKMPYIENGDDVFDIYNFDIPLYTHRIEIDFNNPNLVQNKLIELTEQIENLCPVAKHFDVEGVGEGIVWSHVTDDGEQLIFKVKGEKHSSTKVKKLASVDVEKLNSVMEFVEYAVTESRLKQALFEVCNDVADRTQLGKFIKWVSSDISKEEQDTLKENELTMKDVGSQLSKKAKEWFFEQENKQQ